MLTIMSGMSPTPRLRSGFQSAASSVQPSAALSTIAMMIASQIGNARSTPKVSTISAPNVTISACAKLESPVVPKISERPIAASASRSPKFSPLMTRMSTWALMSVVVRCALAEEEVHRLAVGESELGGHGVLAVLHDDALRQGVLVERELVLALLGDADRPPAVGVGLGLGVVAVAFDRDADAFQGLVVEGHVAGEEVLELLGLRRRTPGHRHRRGRCDAGEGECGQQDAEEDEPPPA